MKKILRFLFATPTVKRDRLNLRLWYFLFCLYLIAIAAVSLWAGQRYGETGSPGFRMIWLLGLYVFYFSLACTFVPLPTSWFVLFLASPVGGFTLSAPQRVALVAALGAFGTAVSHLNEYHLISFFLRIGRMHRVKETRIYRWAENIFKSSPFMLQMAFNVVPIPADPARWLAIMYGYPLPKFFLAHWLGRFIRYGLMGFASEIMELTVLQIAIVQVVLLTIPAMRIPWRRLGATNQEANTTEEQNS